MPNPTTDQREMERAFKLADTLAGMKHHNVHATAEETQLLARALLRMKAAVDSAPHAPNCFRTRRWQDNNCRHINGLGPLPDGECDCWKAEL